MWAIGGLGALIGLISGNQAQQRNNELQKRADGFYGQQGKAIDSMTGYAGPMQGVIDQQQGLIGQQQGNIGQQQGLLGGYGDLRGTLGGLAGQAGALTGQYGQDTGGLLGQYQSLFQRAGGYTPQQGAIGDGGGAAALMQNARGMLGEVDPGVYQRSAQLAGNDAMSALGNSLASRGIASSGTMGRVGASTLAKLYADSAARGQQDRLTARQAAGSMYGTAGGLGLQASGLNIQNAQMVNQAQQQQSGLLASLLGQQGQLMDNRFGNTLQGLQMQRGLAGDQGNLLGQQLAGLTGLNGQLGSMNGQLGNINGQYGGIANLYGNAASLYGNAAAGQQNQMNPNPYGGLTAGLGALGNALGALGQGGAGQTMRATAAPGLGTMGAFGTPMMRAAVMPGTAVVQNPLLYMGGGRNPWGAS